MAHVRPFKELAATRAVRYRQIADRPAWGCQSSQISGRMATPHGYSFSSEIAMATNHDIPLVDLHRHHDTSHTPESVFRVSRLLNIPRFAELTVEQIGPFPGGHFATAREHGCPG